MCCQGQSAAEFVPLWWVVGIRLASKGGRVGMSMRTHWSPCLTGEGAGVVVCLSNDLRGVQMETGGDDEAPKGARRGPEGEDGHDCYKHKTGDLDSVRCHERGCPYFCQSQKN